jgi:hypothetical protein
MSNTKRFNPVLAKYYEIWYRDSWDSFVYYANRKYDTPLTQEYYSRWKDLFELINEHWYEIEYYHIGDRAMRVAATLKFQQWLTEVAK